MNALARFRRLSRHRQWLLAEAVINLVLSSTAVALLPFRRAILVGAVPLRGSGPTTAGADCVWAIEAAARRLPLRTMCIERGIALQRMLRRRGADARLHYGAQTDPATGRLKAHVWVMVGPKAMIGGADAADFAQLAVYP